MLDGHALGGDGIRLLFGRLIAREPGDQRVDGDRRSERDRDPAAVFRFPAAVCGLRKVRAIRSARMATRSTTAGRLGAVAQAGCTP
jgi:hypothetical protein